MRPRSPTGFTSSRGTWARPCRRMMWPPCLDPTFQMAALTCLSSGKQLFFSWSQRVGQRDRRCMPTQSSVSMAHPSIRPTVRPSQNCPAHVGCVPPRRLQEVNSMINKRLKDALFSDQWSELCMDTLSPFGYVLVGGLQQ